MIIYLYKYLQYVFIHVYVYVMFVPQPPWACTASPAPLTAPQPHASRGPRPGPFQECCHSAACCPPHLKGPSEASDATCGTFLVLELQPIASPNCSASLPKGCGRHSCRPTASLDKISMKRPTFAQNVRSPAVGGRARSKARPLRIALDSGSSSCETPESICTSLRNALTDRISSEAGPFHTSHMPASYKTFSRPRGKTWRLSS